ncbi:MAG: hypothetical protein R3Y63_11080 [Eubacteriales bacterium]
MKKSVPLLISAILSTLNVLALLMIIASVNSATALVDGVLGGFLGGIMVLLSKLLGTYAMPYLLVVGVATVITWFAWGNHNKILVMIATALLAAACVLRFALIVTLLIPIACNVFAIYSMNAE